MGPLGILGMIVPTIATLGRRAMGGLGSIRSGRIGTRTRESIDPSQAAKTFGYPAGTQLTTGALKRGAGLDALIGGAEGLAAVDLVTEEDPSMLDYGLASFYGLSGIGS